MIKGGKYKSSYGDSTAMEETLRAAVVRVADALDKKFDHDFVWTPSLKLSDIAKKSRIKRRRLGDKPVWGNGKIIPDGGILSMCYGGSELPILFSEAKHQDSSGNAWERMAKNMRMVEIYMKDENIYPYLCLCQGQMFGVNYTQNQISLMNWNSSLNENYVYKDDGVARASLHLRPEKWTEDEMFKISYEIAEESVYYYTQNRGKKWRIPWA